MPFNMQIVAKMLYKKGTVLMIFLNKGYKSYLAKTFLRFLKNFKMYRILEAL